MAVRIGTVHLWFTITSYIHEYCTSAVTAVARRGAQAFQYGASNSVCFHVPPSLHANTQQSRESSPNLLLFE